MEKIKAPRIPDLLRMSQEHRDAYRLNCQAHELNLKIKEIELLEKIHRSLRLLSSETD